MDKRYDQRCTLCPGCHHFWKAGMRDIYGGLSQAYFPDGCMRYGYSFHDCYEPAEECEGFETEEQYQFRMKQQELLRKRKKK